MLMQIISFVVGFVGFLVIVDSVMFDRFAGRPFEYRQAVMDRINHHPMGTGLIILTGLFISYGGNLLSSYGGNFLLFGISLFVFGVVCYRKRYDIFGSFH